MSYSSTQVLPLRLALHRKKSASFGFRTIRIIVGSQKYLFCILLTKQYKLQPLPFVQTDKIMLRNELIVGAVFLPGVLMGKLGAA